MNKETLKNQIYEDVSKMYKQRVWISRIQERLLKNFEQEVPIELIREICKEVKENKEIVKDIKKWISSKEKEKADWWLKNLVDDIGDDKKYDYFPETGHLLLYIDWKQKSLLLSTLEAIIEDYSKMGSNLSWKQIQIKYQLTPKVWLFIKSTFNIYKDSTPFDPITLSSFTSEEDMKISAKEKADRLTEWKMQWIFNKAEQQAKDSLFRKMSKDIWWADKKLDAILAAAKKRKPIEFWEIKPLSKPNNKIKDVFMSDAHLWKKGTDWIVIRFKKLTRELIECEESEINITFWWDLWEQFVARWEKHPWMKLWMEDINLEDLFMLILDVFEEMLLAIYKSWKTVTFNGLWGNHDSFESNKDFDPQRSPAMIIYRLLDKALKDTTVKINILREKYNVIKKDNIKFVYAHWDNIRAATANRIALEHIEDWYYLIIVTWDKHHFESHELSDRIMWIQSPALAWPWKYDIWLAMSSQPWVIFFEKNRDGMIDILLKRYK